MPILTCIFFTFNWLTLTSEIHYVKFHPEIASCLLSRGKRKYAPLEMRLLWKYIRNYFLVYQLTSHFLSYLQNYKEFEAEILDLQPENIWAFIWYQNNVLLPVEPWGGENVIGIRSFKKTLTNHLNFSVLNLALHCYPLGFRYIFSWIKGGAQKSSEGPLRKIIIQNCSFASGPPDKCLWTVPSLKILICQKRVLFDNYN